MEGSEEVPAQPAEPEMKSEQARTGCKGMAPGQAHGTAAAQLTRARQAPAGPTTLNVNSSRWRQQEKGV